MVEVIQAAIDQLRERQGAYRTYTDYYAGKHRLAFATDKFRQAFGSVISAFACNISAVVVDTIADRLQVTGFAADQGAEADAERAKELWDLNSMGDLAGRVHREALRCGDAYCLVWRKDGDEYPRVYPQYACRMAVGRDEDDPSEIAWAARWWTLTDGRIRLNLYTSEDITKWVAPKGTESIPEQASSFTPYADEDTEARVPHEWGIVPVAHFPCDPDIDWAGKSELKDIIPLQDGYNKSICDMLVAMEYVSLPQRYATGLEVELDPDTGKPKPTFIPAVDRLWSVGDPEVRFGQFEAANLSQLLEVQQDWELKIARQAKIPPHYLHMRDGAPSGEALKTLDVPLVKKALDRAATFGEAWERVARLLLLMDGRADASVKAVWADPAPLSTRERAEIGDLHRRAGLPKRYVFEQDFGIEGDALAAVLADAQAEEDMAQPALGNPFAGSV